MCKEQLADSYDVFVKVDDDVLYDPEHITDPRVLFYTFIGCTFDATACGYLSGCKNSFKVCDSSAPSSTCNVTLDGTYSYKTLGFKNHEFINYMCKEQLADSYDVFVKVDDDVLYDPEHITDAIGRTGGMHEDLRFGHALSLISQLKHYNMDNLIDAIHLQYRSSRMFVQFMQYGKCAN
ncbi:hypothetical protein GGF43_002689 [Coemansia sp. RSA 2618]|nr:hypothetical protein GGF43_002689 [Coemansia sp. RSA 2618]